MRLFFSVFSLALVGCSSSRYNSSKFPANRVYLTRTYHISRRKPYHDALNVPLYIPLDPKQNTIRLLLVNPGRGSEDVDCILSEVSLDRNPPYTALSYTWGPPFPGWEPSTCQSVSLSTLRSIFQRLLLGQTARFPPHQCTIILDGRPVVVTPNLESALRHLRRPDAPLLLWVDALCINQDDFDEKPCQVGLMGQIYGQAKQTIIWLGPETEGSNRAMDFIDKSDSIDVMDPDFRINSVSPPRPDLEMLFARSWWSRVWVIQEAILSKQAIVKCGYKEVGFEKVINLALKHKMLLRRIRTEPDFFKHQKYLAEWLFMPTSVPFFPLLFSWRSMTFPLWDTLLLTSSFNSTLPRDKVYGVLGICAQQDREAINIDYSGCKPDSAIYRDVIKYVIKSRSNLEPLQFVVPCRRMVDLPSWVPDIWQSNYYDLYTLSPLTGMKFNASYEPYGWLRLNHPFLIPLVFDYWFIFRPGFIFSILSLFGRTLRSSRDSGAVFSDDNVLTLRGIPFDTIAYADSAHVIEEMLNSNQLSALAFPAVASTLRGWENAVASYKPNPYQTPEERYGAFWRTMITNRIHQGTDGANRSSYTVPLPSDSLVYQLFSGRRSLPKNRKEAPRFKERLARFQMMMHRAFIRRSFAITSRGFLGVVPENARAGDLICVLQGGAVPFVIRPKSDDEWEFLGECYIHGIMDGEVVKRAKSKDVRVYHLK